MPEGPELHLASLYVNRMCDGVVFTGAVQKSEVSKSPDVPFTCGSYRIIASSRGKEVKLTLTPIKNDQQGTGDADRPMDIVFRFGMSGTFRFTAEDDVPKHAHLRFYTKEKPCRVLSFVDTRRFGSWHPDGTWQRGRGPCVMFEYESFRENVVSNLSDKAFDRPICEVLLNQKYFNGIGNYLRAEILFRLNIPPFVSARDALQGLTSEDECENKKPVKEEVTGMKRCQRTKKKIVKEEEADLLRLCHTVPLEVVSLGGKGFNPEKSEYAIFETWLQCYYVDGMKSVRDHNGRTMWFKGEPGPMAPRDSKSPRAKKNKKQDEEHDYTQKKKVGRRQSESGVRGKAGQQDVPAKRSKKEKDARSEETRSVRRKSRKGSEVGTPQDKKKATSRRRKNSQAEAAGAPQDKKNATSRRRKKSQAEAAGGPQRRSARLTRQNNK